MTCMESVKERRQCADSGRTGGAMGAASGFSGGYAEISGSCRSCKKIQNAW